MPMIWPISIMNSLQYTFKTLETGKTWNKNTNVSQDLNPTSLLHLFGYSRPYHSGIIIKTVTFDAVEVKNVSSSGWPLPWYGVDCVGLSLYVVVQGIYDVLLCFQRRKSNQAQTCRCWHEQYFYSSSAWISMRWYFLPMLHQLFH